MSFVSPGLVEALNSAETEAQARGRISMLHVIQRGVERKTVETKPCPWCCTDPGLAAKIAGRFIIACEAEDCAANPQVSGETLEAAWAAWNGRA